MIGFLIGGIVGFLYGKYFTKINIWVKDQIDSL